MGLPVQLLPTPAGLALAMIAVALGAPIFSDGLRALRLHRSLGALRHAPLDADTDGFSHASGTVVLDSPLFSPLSGRPCAGFVLEVASEARPVRRRLEMRRPFRLVEGGVAARVPSAHGRWACQPTATRRIGPQEPLSENLAHLLAGVPEATWLRRGGATLELTERALLAGSTCHVVGVARSAASVAYAEALEVERTGTDDVALTIMGGRPAAEPPAIAFSSGEALDFLLVTDREPARELLAISPLRVIGVALGPVLSLAGIFYLAAVADALRAAGRT